MNDKVELLLYHRKETGMKKLDGYDNRIKRVGCMLKESSLQRGYAWRLREAGDKDEKSHWDEFLLVLTEKGRLMMEPNDSQVAAANASARKLVLDFDMTAIVRHDAIEMQCLGGAGMQLIFRVQHGARRSNQFLYLAFGEKGSKEYEEWWRALRKFSWRADDINTDHLDSTKWKPDEKVIWDQIEQVFRQVSGPGFGTGQQQSICPARVDDRTRFNQPSSDMNCGKSSKCSGGGASESASALMMLQREARRCWPRHR